MIVTLDDAPAGRILRDPAGGVITYPSATVGGRFRPDLMITPAAPLEVAAP